MLKNARKLINTHGGTLVVLDRFQNKKCIGGSRNKAKGNPNAIILCKKKSYIRRPSSYLDAVLRC